MNEAAVHERYERILKQERSWAQSVAIGALKPKPVSVWEVIIPVFLVFGYMRLKGAREVFAENLVFTKKLALDAACDRVLNRRSREEVMASVRARTEELLRSVEGGLYSKDIRRRQLEEIDLLIDHYGRLLAAEGGSYQDLVRAAYAGREPYTVFLERLRQAEKRVSEAATQTLGERADRQTLSRIEEVSDKLRMKSASDIFAGP